LISEKLIKWALLGFLGGGVALSIVGTVGMVWKKEIFLSKNIPRIKWNLPGAEGGLNPNPIGGTILLVIPLGLVLFLSYLKGKKENYFISNKFFGEIFFFFVLFTLCLVLFFTQSTGSWIGLILSIWILPQTWKWKKISLALIIILVGFVIFLKPVKNLFIGESDQNTQAKNKIEKRVSFWISGLDAISHHPIFGIGMNRIRKNPAVGYEGAHAHNHLLHTGAELGIPALIAYLALLTGAGYMCYETWRKAKIGWMKIAAQGLASGQLAHFIFGMGDSVPLGAKVGIFFWFSLALIAAMYNYMLKSDEDLKLKQKVHSSRLKLLTLKLWNR